MTSGPGDRGFESRLPDHSQRVGLPPTRRVAAPPELFPQLAAAGEMSKTPQKNGPFKSIEERPDILASMRFLARIDESADRQTRAAVSWGRDNTQEISRRLTAGGRSGGRAEGTSSEVRNLSTESDQAHTRLDPSNVHKAFDRVLTAAKVHAGPARGPCAAAGDTVLGRADRLLRAS